MPVGRCVTVKAGAARMTWRGQYGAVLLGPTEHRVATYLEAATRDGLVTLRTTAIASRLKLSRSEAYRILATLRRLGLFGVSSDQGGTTGGRRIWRTSRMRDGSSIDPRRHRAAWARVTGWLQARAHRLAAAIAGISQARLWPATQRRADRAHGGRLAVPARGSAPLAGAGPPSTLGDAMRRLAPALAKEWRL